MTAAATAQLRDVGVFQGLTEDEIRTLLEGAERQEFPAGAVIFKEGDPVTGLFVIQSGSVSVEKKTAAGTQHKLATLEAKHVFGEMGLLVGGRPRTATVTAAAATVVWHFATERITKLLEHGSPAASKLLLNMSRVLAGRLDGLNKELLKLVDQAGPGKAKVAELASFKDKLYKEWSF
jgi:CRP-like cAMP-binding protein